MRQFIPGLQSRDRQRSLSKVEIHMYSLLWQSRVFVWHCRYVQRCPLSFLQSGSVKPLLACAIAGCALDHKEANYSVTKFLSELSKTARDKEVSQQSISLCILYSPLLSSMDYEVEAVWRRWRPKKTWREFIENLLLDLTTERRGC